MSKVQALVDAESVALNMNSAVEGVSKLLNGKLETDKEISSVGQSVNGMGLAIGVVTDNLSSKPGTLTLFSLISSGLEVISRANKETDPDKTETQGKISDKTFIDAMGVVTGAISLSPLPAVKLAFSMLSLAYTGVSTVYGDELGESTEISDALIASGQTLDAFFDFFESSLEYFNVIGNNSAPKEVLAVVQAIDMFSTEDEINSLFDESGVGKDKSSKNFMLGLRELLVGPVADRDNVEYQALIRDIHNEMFEKQEPSEVPNIEPYVLKQKYASGLKTVRTEELAKSAKQTNIDGLAYRYALEKLNAFAFVGNASLYEKHNLNGELDVEFFSDNYLKDRAAMLAHQIELHRDENYRHPTKDIEYIDHKTGTELKSHNLNAPKVVFGYDNGDSEIRGSVGDDRLYGGRGDDRIVAGSGSDVLQAISIIPQQYIHHVELNKPKVALQLVFVTHDDASAVL